MKKDVKPAEKPAQTAAGPKWSQLSIITDPTRTSMILFSFFIVWLLFDDPEPPTVRFFRDASGDIEAVRIDWYLYGLVVGDESFRTDWDPWSEFGADADKVVQEMQDHVGSMDDTSLLACALQACISR